MSSAANWSYTASATVWHVVSRDDWAGGTLYSPPVVIACDYGAKAEQRTDSAGREFTSRQMVYTEHATAKPGDYVLIGVSTEPDPLAAGAMEIRSVTRHADTFARLADDYELAS